MDKKTKVIMDAFIAGKNNVSDIVFIKHYLPDLIKELSEKQSEVNK